MAGSAVFWSGDQPFIFHFALRDGVACGGGVARGGAMAGDSRIGSVDSAGGARRSSPLRWTRGCDRVHIYVPWDAGAGVLRMGIVCGAAVLSGAVLGAGVKFS